MRRDEIQKTLLQVASQAASLAASLIWFAYRPRRVPPWEKRDLRNKRDFRVGLQRIYTNLQKIREAIANPEPVEPLLVTGQATVPAGRWLRYRMNVEVEVEAFLSNEVSWMRSEDALGLGANAAAGAIAELTLPADGWTKLASARVLSFAPPEGTPLRKLARTAKEADAPTEAKGFDLPRQCSKCGCTERNPCLVLAGPPVVVGGVLSHTVCGCSWTPKDDPDDPDLCSSCSAPETLVFRPFGGDLQNFSIKLPAETECP